MYFKDILIAPIGELGSRLSEPSTDMKHRQSMFGRHPRSHCQLGNQIGRLRLTGLGEVVLIPPDSLRVAFRAIAGFQVVGRGNTQRRWRLLVRGAPTECCEPGDGTPAILL